MKRKLLFFWKYMEYIRPTWAFHNRHRGSQMVEWVTGGKQLATALFYLPVHLPTYPVVFSCLPGWNWAPPVGCFPAERKSVCCCRRPASRARAVLGRRHRRCVAASYFPRIFFLALDCSLFSNSSVWYLLKDSFFGGWLSRDDFGESI